MPTSVGHSGFPPLMESALAEKGLTPATSGSTYPTYACARVGSHAPGSWSSGEGSTADSASRLSGAVALTESFDGIENGVQAHRERLRIIEHKKQGRCLDEMWELLRVQDHGS